MVSDGVRGHGPRRVVIVDRRVACADLLRVALNRLDDFECVGAACTAAQAQAVVERTVPDLVVVDVMLRGGTALRLIRRLRGARDDLVVVITAASADIGMLMAVAVAGGNGFAPRTGAGEELLSVLRSARPGAMSVAPSLLAATGTGGQECYPGRLTARESHVLALMSRGASAPEIARVLSISPATSRDHIRSIHSKLGVRTRHDAVIKAQQIGLLEPAHR